MDLDTRKIVYNSAIASRLGYADTVWDGCSKKNSSRLQVIQNMSARRICINPTKEPTIDLIRNLKWLTLKEKRNMHKATLMYRMKKDNTPGVLVKALLPTGREQERSTRQTSNGDIFITSYRTNAMAKSLMISGSKLWNQLPVEIRTSDNWHIFKSRLYKYLISLTPDR